VLTLPPPGCAKSPRSYPRREDRTIGRDQGDAGVEREDDSEEDRRGGEEATGNDEGGEYDRTGEEERSMNRLGLGDAWDWRWEVHLEKCLMGDTWLTCGMDAEASVQYDRVNDVVCIKYLTCCLVYSFLRDYAFRPMCNITDEQDASQRLSACFAFSRQHYYRLFINSFD
jgi:hypothetical protein